MAPSGLAELRSSVTMLWFCEISPKKVQHKKIALYLGFLTEGSVVIVRKQVSETGSHFYPFSQNKQIVDKKNRNPRMLK